MPPPIIGGAGGRLPGVIPVNEWQDEAVALGPFDDDAYYGRNECRGSPVDDMFNNTADDTPNKSKGKGKAKTNDKDPVTTSYRGYLLEKAEPPPGEKADWSRVIKNDLPIAGPELAEEIMRRFKQNKLTPHVIFDRLSPLQRRMVTRLIAEQNRDEKNSNAVWTFAGAWRFGEERRGKMVNTHTMHVVLKRSAKDALIATDKGTARPSDDVKFGEILDLSKPLSSKEDSGKGKDKDEVKHQDKTQWQDRDDEYPRSEEHDPRPRLRQDLRRGQPQLYDRPQPIAVNEHLPQPWEQSQQRPWEQPMPVSPRPVIVMPGQRPMPGAIPIPQPRRQAHEHPVPNPFQPQPHVSFPGQFDEPVWQPPQPRPRSQTPEPRHRRSSSERQLRKPEAKLDHVVERLENLSLASDQSSEGRDADSVFWSILPTGSSRTPPSPGPAEGNLRGVDLLRHRSKLGERDRVLEEDPVRQRRHEKQIRYPRRTNASERGDRRIRDRWSQDPIRREDAVTIIPASSPLRTGRVRAWSGEGDGEGLLGLGRRRRTVLVEEEEEEEEEEPSVRPPRLRYAPEVLDELDYGRPRGGGRRKEAVVPMGNGDRRREAYYRGCSAALRRAGA